MRIDTKGTELFGRWNTVERGGNPKNAASQKPCLLLSREIEDKARLTEKYVTL